MRMAILSDIHGNPIALNAVLADIHGQGAIDSYWVLGDFSAIGYDPVAVLERLARLADVQVTRGNTDRYIITGELPGPSLEDVLNNPALLAKAREVIASFSWTQGYVTGAGWLDWFTRLPLEITTTLPDGTSVLGVHAAPGTDDGPGLHPGLSDEEILALIEPCGADLVFVGHTHVAMDRTVQGKRVVNLGSVSNPVTLPLQASYVILEADSSGYQLQHRQVAYDLEAVIAAIQKSRHPAGDFIVRYMQGKQLSRWA